MQGFLCGELQAETAEMRWTYVIHRANDVYSRVWETQMFRRFRIQMIFCRHGIPAANNDHMQFMCNCWAPNDG